MQAEDSSCNYFYHEIIVGKAKYLYRQERKIEREIVNINIVNMLTLYGPGLAPLVLVRAETIPSQVRQKPVKLRETF